MQLKKGTYWRYNPDSSRTYVDIGNNDELRYHQDLLENKGYQYEPSN